MRLRLTSVRIVGTTSHQVLCTVTYAAFHHFSVLVFGVPLPSEPFTCRTLTIPLAFAGHKSKYRFGEPETFSSLLSGESLPTSFGGTLVRASEAAIWLRYARET